MLRRQTLTLAISNVGTALLSFALAALIARALGEVGLGAYAVALAWVMPLSLLVEFGIGTLITREVAARAGHGDGRHEWRPYNLVPLASRARWVMGLPLMIALVLAAPLLTSDAIVARGIQVSAPLVLIQPLFSTYSAVFRGRGDMLPIPWLNIGMLAVQVGLTWMLLGGQLAQVLPTPDGRPAGHPDDREAVGTPFMASAVTPNTPLVIDTLVINTLTSAGQLVACWAWYRRRYYVRADGEGASLWRLLRQSWNFGLAALFAAVQMRMSTVLLESLRGVSEAGLYAGANRFVEAGRLLPNAYFGALFPRLGALAEDPTAMRQSFRAALLVMLGYGAASAIALGVLATPLLVWVYGDAFAPAATGLIILGVAFVFSLLRGTLTLYRYAQRREAFVNRVNLVVIVVQLGLSVVLIPRMGVEGAAWAMLGAEVVAFVALSLLARSIVRRTR